MEQFKILSLKINPLLSVAGETTVIANCLETRINTSKLQKQVKT